jgi:hypothetical protein
LAAPTRELFDELDSQMVTTTVVAGKVIFERP